MEKSLTLEVDGQETAQMQAGITRCFAEIDELRNEMRAGREAIKRSSRRIDVSLTRIAEVLAELKAA